MGGIRTYPVTMIVAEKLTAKMTKSLPGKTLYTLLQVTKVFLQIASTSMYLSN